MSSPGAVSKRRSFGQQASIEEQALNIIAKEADNREEKSSAFLAEARKIRSSEREKNKKNDVDEDEEEDESTTIPDTPLKHTTPASRPVAIPAAGKPQLEHLSSRDGVNEMQEKYKKLMMANVQLDNEKQAVTYQVELLKDILSDKEEEFLGIKGRLHKMTQERDRLQSELTGARARCDKLMVDLEQRDSIIKTSGLSLITVDNATPTTTTPDNNRLDVTSGNNMAAAVLTADHLEILADYSGSLGQRLKQLFDDRLATAEENKKLQKEIEALKADQSQSASQTLASSSLDETQKLFTETKLKLKRAEQEITTLHGTVTRLDTQMIRYKTSAENLEKTEEELKAEKRKLQIELRESKSRIEELESKNGILAKRVEKLKLAKNLLETS